MSTLEDALTVNRTLSSELAIADRRVEELEAALSKAIQAAWDGPAETVGTGCAETYGQWRKRLESECRAALSAQPPTRPVAPPRPSPTTIPSNGVPRQDRGRG